MFWADSITEDITDQSLSNSEYSWFDLSISSEAHEARKTLSSLSLLSALTDPNPQRGYESFTRSQAGPEKLTRELFDWLQTQFSNVPARLIAVTLLIHDLGKTNRAREAYREHFKDREIETGHDELLRSLVQARGHLLFPSLNYLSLDEIAVLEEWLAADFNPLQFVQGEGPASILEGVRTVSDAAFVLGAAEALGDVAGFAGLPPGRGSAVCTSPVTAALQLAFETLKTMRREQWSSGEAMEHYLRARAGWIGIWKDHDEPLTPELYALTRVACALRWTTPERGPELLEGFESLKRESGCRGKDLRGAAFQFVRLLSSDGIASKAVLAEYLPDLSIELYRTGRGLGMVLFQLTRVLEKMDLATFRRGITAGTTKVVVSNLRDAAKRSDFGELDFEILGQGPTFDAVVQPTRARVVSGELPQATLPSDPGAAVFITVGGGADAVNAAVASRFIERRTGVKASAFIHIRSSSPSSAALDGSPPTRISFDGAEVLSPVTFRLSADSHPAPGSKFRHTAWATVPLAPTYVLLDEAADSVSSLRQSLSRILASLPDAQVIVFDTGGDILDQDSGQDVRALEATLLSVAAQPVTVAIAALGMDAPPGAEDILRSANASLLAPSSEDRTYLDTWLNEVRELGERQGMGTWFGKSPEVWSKAWNGADGFVCARVPANYLSSPSNPWSTFYRAGGKAAGGLVLVDARGLWQAVSTPASIAP